jgi:hypothetical protein
MFVLVTGITLAIAGALVLQHARGLGGMLRAPRLMTTGACLLVVGAVSGMLALRLLIKALAEWEVATQVRLARRMGPWVFFLVILLPVAAFLVYVAWNRE